MWAQAAKHGVSKSAYAGQLRWSAVSMYAFWSAPACGNVLTHAVASGVWSGEQVQGVWSGEQVEGVSFSTTHDSTMYNAVQVFPFSHDSTIARCTTNASNNRSCFSVQFGSVHSKFSSGQFPQGILGQCVSHETNTAQHVQPLSQIARLAMSLCICLMLLVPNDHVPMY